MKLSPKALKWIKWIARITALMALAFGLPFYFGYGNPLPFINPNNSLGDNAWLTVFPLMFIGLALGWRYEKAGGFLIVIPITLAMTLGLLTGYGAGGPTLVPLIIGVLYLIVGYKS